jgi:diguanylate cyclase (GGDEF)-like protein
MRLPLDGLDEDLTVRASVGVSGSPEQTLDATSLIKAADQALYRAKQQGKNRTTRAAGRRAAEAVSR